MFLNIVSRGYVKEHRHFEMRSRKFALVIFFCEFLKFTIIDLTQIDPTGVI